MITHGIGGSQPRPRPQRTPRAGARPGRGRAGCFAGLFGFLRSQGRGRAVPPGCQKTNRVCVFAVESGLASSLAGGSEVEALSRVFSGNWWCLQWVRISSPPPPPPPPSFREKSTLSTQWRETRSGCGDKPRRWQAIVTSVPARLHTPASRDIFPRGGGEAAARAPQSRGCRIGPCLAGY